MSNCASKILLAFLVSAAWMGAQEAQPAAPAAAPAAPDAASIVLAPAPKDYTAPAHTDSDGVTRTVSPGLAAALAQGMPKFSPPTPTPVPTGDPVDLRDVDKPKNEIKRLPKYVVVEKRPPVFRDRDLYSAQGLAALSFKNHAGLIFGNILGLNEGAAYNMYLEDERKDNMDDMTDMAHAMAQGGSSAEGSYILQQSSDTYMREAGGWDWSGGGIVGGTSK
jgi:hypothetical protein